MRECEMVCERLPYQKSLPDTSPPIYCNEFGLIRFHRLSESHQFVLAPYHTYLSVLKTA